ATPLRRMESSTVCGSGSPDWASASLPAACCSHSSFAPAASSTRTVAAVTSGPMPSPGMRVTVRVVMGADLTVPGMAVGRWGTCQLPCPAPLPAELFQLGDDVAVVAVDAVQLDERLAGRRVVAHLHVDVAHVVEEGEHHLLLEIGGGEAALVPLD